MKNKDQKIKYKASLRDIAYHEAGHVTTGFLFYQVNGVKIEAGKLMEFGTLGTAEIEMAKLITQPYPPFNPDLCALPAP